MVTIKTEIPPTITLTRHSSMTTTEKPVKRPSSLIPSDSFKTPVRKPAEPIFGTPSLLSRMTAGNSVEEEMHWAPPNGYRPDDAVTLTPGDLGTEPTGMESHLAGTSLVNEPSVVHGRSESQTGKRPNSDFFAWIQSQDVLVMGGVIVTIAILLLGAVLPTWQKQKGALWDPSWDWSHFEETRQAPMAEQLPLDDWNNAEAA